MRSVETWMEMEMENEMEMPFWMERWRWRWFRAVAVVRSRVQPMRDGRCQVAVWRWMAVREHTPSGPLRTLCRGPRSAVWTSTTDALHRQISIGPGRGLLFRKNEQTTREGSRRASALHGARRAGATGTAAGRAAATTRPRRQWTTSATTRSLRSLYSLGDVGKPPGR